MSENDKDKKPEPKPKRPERYEYFADPPRAEDVLFKRELHEREKERVKRQLEEHEPMEVDPADNLPQAIRHRLGFQSSKPKEPPTEAETNVQKILNKPRFTDKDFGIE